MILLLMLHDAQGVQMTNLESNLLKLLNTTSSEILWPNDLSPSCSARIAATLGDVIGSCRLATLNSFRTKDLELIDFLDTQAKIVLEIPISCNEATRTFNWINEISTTFAEIMTT